MTVSNVVTIRMFACLIASYLSVVSCWAKSDSIEIIEPRSCFFGNGLAMLTFTSDETPEQIKRVKWAMRDENRVLDRGMTPVKSLRLADDGGPKKYEVAIPLPPVREDIQRRVEIEISTMAGDTLRHSIWLFPRKAFSEHNRWWETTPIRLFDPVGKTSALLGSQGIPSQALRSLTGIEENKAGVLLIGQGISLREHPRLIESLTRAASSGRRILCLAPNEGDWPISFDDTKVGFTPDFSLQSLGFLNRYNKHYDLIEIAAPLGLTTHHGRVVVRFGEGHWAWLQLRYSQANQVNDGHLLVCSLDLIKQWDDSPVPRHLLASMLKHLATNVSHKELK